jgi:hypothetical protein
MFKEITENDYLNLFKNGARNLFDWYEFRFLDGGNYDLEPEQSYIIIRFNDDDSKSYFQVDKGVMYDFITIYHYAYPEVRDEFITDKIMELGIDFNE